MTPDAWPAPTAQSPIEATVSLPGSKSLTNRALLLAAIADGPSVVRRALRSRDTELMAKALAGLGADIDTSGDDWTVRPGRLVGDVDIDCGLAGTVMRFVPPVAALCDGPVRFDGDEHARTRPMAQVLAGLRAAGVHIAGEDHLPFTVLGRGNVSGGTVEIDASASSQFISALLLAGARFDEGITVRHVGPPVPSQPHIDMTLACLRDHGVQVETGDDEWRVAPGPIAAVDVDIEPDLSNAAPFLMLPMIAGGSVTVRDWPTTTTQAGDALREILTDMGGQVEFTDDGLRVTGTGAIGGIEIDLHDLGELTPAIAALCALADSPSHLTGIAHIRGHETDRLAALATELRRVGSDVVEHQDGLQITPATLRAAAWQTYADHRMAHAGVIIAAAVAGTEVVDVATTSKTFPGFVDVWSGLF